MNAMLSFSAVIGANAFSLPCTEPPAQKIEK
jgi:hypothetical protein